MNRLQLEFAKSLFELAWADGQVNQFEITLIASMLERLGVTLVERIALMDQALDAPFTVRPDLDAVLPTRADRLLVLEQLVSVSFVDGEATSAEVEILGNLANHWGVNAQELESLRRHSSQSNVR